MPENLLAVARGTYRTTLLILILLIAAEPAWAERITLKAVATGDETNPAVREALQQHRTPPEYKVESQLLSGSEFTLDTLDNVLEYRLARSRGKEAALPVLLHGFAPAGWRARVITRLEVGPDGRGRWEFDDQQEKNLLAGLAYLTLPGEEGRQRVRLLPPLEPVTRFPPTVEATIMAGTCHTRISLFDILPPTEADMDGAQVIIVRTPPGDVDGDSLRDEQLAVEVRIGGGYVPGLGPINIEMLDAVNPGLVEARDKSADFPARMTLDLRKRYETPVGTFISEVESYEASAIYGFPPYGAELVPTTPVVRLLDERSGQHVGNLYPGTIVPLFALDLRSFPLDKVPPFEAIYALDPFPEVGELQEPKRRPPHSPGDDPGKKGKR